MTVALLLTIRFHEPRYHGSGAWPPAPMRLFQALVAGAARGASLSETDRAALNWLECLPAPEIIAPPVRRATSYTNYVPNNDGDAEKDLARPQKKSGKDIHPYLFEPGAPLHYLWAPVEDCVHACNLCTLAERLHHLGRGVDPAWCEARLLREDDALARVAGQGIHHRPSGSGGATQAVPVPGTLESLERRFKENCEKFKIINGKRAFSQPPKAVLREVSYDAPPDRVLYELRKENHGFVQVSPREAVTLTTTLLKAAAARLTSVFSGRKAELERLIIGRGATAEDKLRRIRLIPLPSIGHEHVDRAIRRVVLEIPQACPIRQDTLLWAFDGLAHHDRDGVVLGSLVRANETQMLQNYVRESELWQTETPVVLPFGRRRVKKGDSKDGRERAEEEGKAVAGVAQALRHAGIEALPAEIEVQREPFSGKGTLCKDVEPGRFDRHALWHVRLRFERPFSGPLVIGNGRFAGLGVMSPGGTVPADVWGVQITDGLKADVDHAALAHALRRAIMARVRGALGQTGLPSWFTGHEMNGTPLAGGSHNHLAIVPDLSRQRLLIIAPHRFDHRSERETGHLRTLAAALQDFAELRAGSAGVLAVRTEPASVDDILLGSARVWESLTPFAATRHPRRESAEDALVSDVSRELNRRGLPRAEVEVLDVLDRSGRPAASLKLTFAVAQTGPILLGRTLHKGGGVFKHGTST